MTLIEKISNSSLVLSFYNIKLYWHIFAFAFGAVHKLCRLKIGNFWPPPLHFVVFLASKIDSFWTPFPSPRSRGHSLWMAPLPEIGKVYPHHFIVDPSITYCTKQHAMKAFSRALVDRLKVLDNELKAFMLLLPNPRFLQLSIRLNQK